MGTPIHSHYKKMNGKHRGRHIWKARGTAQLLRSTQNFCLLHHISLFYTFSVIFVQKVKYWLSYTPVKKDPANLVEQMNGFLWSHTCVSAGRFLTVCNSINTGLFAQKSLKGCRMDWCDVEDKRFVWIWVTGLFHGPSKCAAPYVFHSLARSQSTPLAKVYTFSHRKSMGKSDHLPKVHT